MGQRFRFRWDRRLSKTPNRTMQRDVEVARHRQGWTNFPWLPLLSVLGWLLAWEVLVRVARIPHYTLPAPSLVLQTLMENFGSLAMSWWFTLKITFGALLLACLGGVLIAVVFALSAPLEAVLLPLAVVLQVTPVVAIAPLMLIYVESTTAALLLCAWIVAFFPILSYFVAGVKVSGGLSLIGAVTAEMVAGAAGRETGLASRILEASFRTETPKMFAALLLLVMTGLMIHAASTALSRRWLVRWHASEKLSGNSR